VKLDADLAIVGSGFGGSLTALIARRLGLSVTLLEKGVHPRFAIGESSSPLANILLETLADRYDLPRIRPLSKYGSWRRTHPQVVCGLKRGFTFYAHVPGQAFAADPSRTDQMLVAASPRDEIADTHWYRPDFDHFLVREAEEAGALYLDRTELTGVARSGGQTRLEGRRPGQTLEVLARLVVDASGPRGFLSRALGIGERPFPELPPTEALYTHFGGVRRMDQLHSPAGPGTPPYPADDAALHHVFPDGWIWVLRFENGITSAGVAATERLSKELRFEEGEPSWRRLLDRLPTVRRHFEGATSLLPFMHHRRLSFRADRAAGPGWTLLPSAAAFVDPLLSTGFPLTLLGIERLGRALEEDWGSERLETRLTRDAGRTLLEADTAALLIAALYSAFDDFALFAALSRLYFAAASYSEAARRLGKAQLAGSFLCADREDFGPEFSACCRAALARPGASARRALLGRLSRAIEPLDVAGLNRAERRNWFPVEAADLFHAAGKLQATEEEVRAMLERSGFLASPGEDRARQGDPSGVIQLHQIPGGVV
jgi:tetracycline 7-halogenase / FADH2 O2-dependent halogenase